jgi:SAM-dependent methyltransferase
LNDKNESCTICGNSIGNTHYQVDERMFQMNQSFDYMLCNKCGTLQLYSQVDDVSHFYPGSYICFAKSENSSSVLHKIIHQIVGWFLLYCPFEILTRKGINSDKYIYLKGLKGIKIRKNSAILDLGCGSGKWLEKLSNLGMKQLTGLDLFNEKDIDTKDKWKFISGEIFDLKDCKFDIIVLHHSFEHMKEPIKVLDKINELLTEKGICIIRIPVMGKYAWREYKNNWVQIDAPRHFYLYSEKAMNYIGKKAGFRLKKIVFDSNEFQLWGSEVYKKKKISLATAGRIKTSLFSEKELLEYKKLAKKLNNDRDGDQAIFYFAKRFK